MSYRRRYRRQPNSIGSNSSVLAYLANRLGPRGAVFAGVVGFGLFYLLLPAAFEYVIERQKAGVLGQNEAMVRQLLDLSPAGRLVRVFEVLGLASLLVGLAVAVWKLWKQDDSSRLNDRKTGFWATVIARLLD